MCFKKLFNKKEEYPPYTGKTALLFAINNYPGMVSDLRGCVNDQENIHKTLFTEHYPDFTVLKYKNQEVRKWRFREVVSHYVKELKVGDFLFIHYSGHGTQGVDPHHVEEDGYSEALYLYDGPFWDYEISDIMADIPEGATVVVAFDSCFSGGSAHLSRYHNSMRNRFTPIQALKPGMAHRERTPKEQHPRFILYAGSREDQTSADAYIDGEYCGAFTYFWLRSFSQGITYTHWGDRTQWAIKQFPEFDQVPVLIGQQNLLSQIVFI